MILELLSKLFASKPVGAVPELPWVSEGRKLLGTHEVPGPGNNPKIMAWAKEMGFSDYTADSIPWCVLFLDYILFRAGIKILHTLFSLDYARYGTALSGPAYGAIAVMKRQGGGHVTVCVGRDAEGNFMGLGGNQDDNVTIHSFPVSRPFAWRWPPGFPLPKVGLSTLPLLTATGAPKED